MAKFTTPTDEQQKAWRDWVASRPDNVRKVAERFDPWTLYRMKSSGHRVVVHGFSEGDEGVTLQVAVLAEFNLIAMERNVFGIDPDDLVECDLPEDGEVLGVYLNEDEQIAFVNQKRAENGLPPFKDMDEAQRFSNGERS